MSKNTRIFCFLGLIIIPLMCLGNLFSDSSTVSSKFPLDTAAGDSLLNSDPESTTKKVVVINIEKEIDPGLSYFLKRAVKEAEAKKPDVIIFEVNTFGGRLDAAFEIVDLLNQIKSCSTYAYIKLKAISAGALISLACNKIVMGEATTIGDCAPIIQSQEGIKMAGEKIESPLRAKFRNLAEKNGYPILLAQSMVSMDMHIFRVEKDHRIEYMTQQHWEDLEKPEKKKYKKKKTVVAKGELLTMTDTEAQEYGFSQGSFSSLEDFIKSQNWQKIATVSSNWSEELVRTIGKFAPILMLIGFGALYMEFKAPGFGIFGIIGITCLLIVFGSKYMSGLANHTEFLLLFTGIALIAVELYVMPGTLIFGGLGLGIVIISLILSLQKFTIPNPEFPWQKELFMNNIVVVLGMALISLLIPFLGTKYLLPYLPSSMKVIVDETLKEAKVSSIEREHPEITVGTTGMTKSMLRPFGKIEINSRRYEATAISGYIDPDKKIQVLSIEGNKITVQEIS